MDADGDMTTDRSSTVMTAAPVRPDIVNFAQISNNSAVSRRIPRVANPIGKTRFAREKQEMEEKLGKLISTNEKNKEEEDIASSSSSISAAKVEGLDKELHSANQRKEEDSDTYFAAPLLASRPQRHPLAVRQRQEVGLREDLVAVRQRRLREKAARQAHLQHLKASIRRRRANLERRIASIGIEFDYE